MISKRTSDLALRGVNPVGGGVGAVRGGGGGGTEWHRILKEQEGKQNGTEC